MRSHRSDGADRGGGCFLARRSDAISRSPRDDDDDELYIYVYVCVCVYAPLRRNIMYVAVYNILVHMYTNNIILAVIKRKRLVRALLYLCACDFPLPVVTGLQQDVYVRVYCNKIGKAVVPRVIIALHIVTARVDGGGGAPGRDRFRKVLKFQPLSFRATLRRRRRLKRVPPVLVDVSIRFTVVFGFRSARQPYVPTASVHRARYQDFFLSFFSRGRPRGKW